MRIVIDMQGAQSESRFRGIGRYSIELTKAIIRAGYGHEIFLMLNSKLEDSINNIRNEFHELVPSNNIRVWHSIGPTKEVNLNNDSRRQVAEKMRESAILDLNPDVVLITSMFEGFGDEAVTSVGAFDLDTPVVSILYDLIPLADPVGHFSSNPNLKNYYYRKLEWLKRCKALLAISESSRTEAIDLIKFPEEAIINISTGFDKSFGITIAQPAETHDLLKRFRIRKDYLMYTGGADERKNLHRLIKAFAKLPYDVRVNYQLIMVGKMPPSNIEALERTSNEHGLSNSDLIFTGYVSDETLKFLYKNCKLFIFPSTHEGFGLPPLEAMSCGAPVIGSNLTSIPEVVGLPEALFDPLSVDDITKKILETLTNADFRNKLLKNGRERVDKFSWDAVANKAIETLVGVGNQTKKISYDGVKEVETGIFVRNSLRILVLKLDHMGDFILAIPALTKLKSRYPNALIDIVVGDWNISAAKELGFFNNIFTLNFFKKKSIVEPKLLDETISFFLQGLHKYDYAIDLRRQPDTRHILLKMPADEYVGYKTGDNNIDLLLDLSLKNYPDIPANITRLNQKSAALQMMQLVDLLPIDNTDYLDIPESASLKDMDQVGIAIFPYAGNPVKEWGLGNYRTLIGLLIQNKSVGKIGIFVPKDIDVSILQGIYADKTILYQGLTPMALQAALVNYQICIGNNSFGVHLASFLGLQVVGIYGGHETANEWGPIYGKCKILYAPILCSPCHIAKPSDCKKDLKCLNLISPTRVMDAIQALMLDKGPPELSFDPYQIQQRLIDSLVPDIKLLSNYEINTISIGVSKNISLRNYKRIFVDISELVRRDAKTGIQRVVRAILRNLLEVSYHDYEILPVYADHNHQGYKVAYKFLHEFYPGLSIQDKDQFLEYQQGDIFLGLDLQVGAISAQKNYLKKLQLDGVNIYFVVYDLLPIRLPNYFDKGLKNIFEEWLDMVASFDGAICISKTTAEDLLAWLNDAKGKNNSRFKVKSFTLGADIAESVPSVGMPNDSGEFLKKLNTHMSFLMVGTIEPRKAHADVLNAFEILWGNNSDFILVIIGKEGWLSESLISRLRNHVEFGKRLIWLEGISDEYLERIYQSVAALIYSSYGEGFGLPLIEAAQHGVPILVRDIKIFREIVQDNAYYFQANNPLIFSQEINKWVELYNQNIHPKSSEIKVRTWKQSAEELLKLLS